jgi:hypothetical protein
MGIYLAKWAEEVSFIMNAHILLVAVNRMALTCWPEPFDFNDLLFGIPNPGRFAWIGIRLTTLPIVAVR